MEDDQKKLKKEIKDLNEDVISSLVAERDEILQSKFEYRNKLKESNNTIKNVEDEQKKLKKEIMDLNEDVISSLVAERDEILQSKVEYQNKLKESNNTIKNMEDERKKLKTEIKDSESKTTKSPQPSDSGINIDLNSFKDDIEKKIESMIDIKLTKNLTFAKMVQRNEKPSTPATAVINDVGKRTIIDQRDCNIIIHGLKEDNDTSDEERAKNVFKAVDAQCKPLSVYRLGTKVCNKDRPILISLRSYEEKRGLMANLWRLKYAKHKHGIKERISITHDYTLDERKKIKECVDEVKRRNLQEKTEEYIWQVRGSPKIEMRIVKIRI